MIRSRRRRIDRRILKCAERRSIAGGRRRKRGDRGRAGNTGWTVFHLPSAPVITEAVISRASGRIRSGGGKGERRVGRKAVSAAHLTAEAQKMNRAAVDTPSAHASHGAGHQAAVQEVAPPPAGKGGHDGHGGAVIQFWWQEETRLH
jgi:hypothetical protein